MFKSPTTIEEKQKIETAFGGEHPEWKEGPLKEVLLEYVGTSKDVENVTTEMIVETLANEFPEFLMAVAEENWIRGYQQAIHDVDQGQKMIEAYNEENKDKVSDGTA